MNDSELARELAKTWIKSTIVTSSRSYEEITNELANLIAPLLARMRLDEAKWWAERSPKMQGTHWNGCPKYHPECERLRTLEQAAGGSAAGSEK